MRTALLLIALGFGYKIFAEACQQHSKEIKKLGKLVGIVMMVLSFLGVLCFIAMGSTSICSKRGPCPLMSKVGKMMCPVSNMGR